MSAPAEVLPVVTGMRPIFRLNGRWPAELNRAAICRLPAVPPREVLRAQSGMVLWEGTWRR